jgi:hypothetical protein
VSTFESFDGVSLWYAGQGSGDGVLLPDAAALDHPDFTKELLAFLGST